MEAWIAGLLGTLVGSIGSVAGIWIQNHFQARRERVKMVMEFAVQDRKDLIAHAKEVKQVGPVAPVAVFAHYHGELLRLIESGNFSSKKLMKISEENAEIYRSVQEMHKKRVYEGL